MGAELFRRQCESAACSIVNQGKEGRSAALSDQAQPRPGVDWWVKHREREAAGCDAGWQSEPRKETVPGWKWKARFGLALRTSAPSEPHGLGGCRQRRRDLIFWIGGLNRCP
jgi:hypothetical protein